MTENMKRFFEALSNDKEMAKKVGKMEKEELIAYAKEQGIELTEADFVGPEEEMSEKELADVAGGGECICAIGGGGTEGGKDEVCWCLIGGGGTKEGGGALFPRCECAIAGYGESVN